MRLLHLALPVVAIVAVLSPAVVPTAHACSCMAIDSDEMMVDVIGYFDAVVLGSISATRSGDQYPDRTYFEVDTVFRGAIEQRIALDQDAAQAQLSREYYRSQGYDSLDSLGPDCSYTLFGDEGERYLLFLTPVSGGLWKAGGCSSFALATDHYHPLTPHDRLEMIERVTAGVPEGEPPVQEDEGSTPEPMERPVIERGTTEVTIPEQPRATPPEDAAPTVETGGGSSSWAAVGAGLTLALALIGVSGAIALGSRRRSRRRRRGA